jgi:Right handed beta helix region
LQFALPIITPSLVNKLLLIKNSGMKIFYLAVLVLFISAGITAQPLTGIKTIKASGGDFSSFGAAFISLNTNGVGTGGVTFNVDPGFSSVEDPSALVATGTATNQIVFQKSGAGANPVIRPTGGAGTTDFTVKIAGGDYISFDGIDININTGSAMEYGYVLEGSSANGCQFNTIKNCSVTLNKENASTRCIYTYFASAPSSALFSNSNNKFYNNTLQNALTGYFIFGNSSFPDQDNEIGTVNGGSATISGIGTGTGNTGSTCNMITLLGQQGIKIFNQTITNGSSGSGQVNGINISSSTVNIYSNSISNLSNSSGTSTVYGINGSSNNASIYGNTIDLITATSGPAAGINISGSGTNPVLNLYSNTIKRISTSGSTSLASAFGITNSGAGVTNNVYKNNISEISSNGGALSTAVGLNVSGTTCRVYNNFVAGITAANGTGTASTRGISLVGGTSNFYVYYNSVYLDYIFATSSGSGAAIFLANNSISFDIRNNIFVNNANTAVNVGAKAVAIYAANTTILPILGATCDNDDYFAGTPGANNLIFYDGLNADQTLAAFKSRLVNREQNSITENPPFLSVASPFNLHLSTAIPTQCESKGLPITTPITVNTDIDDETRGATFTDIGADEGDFKLPDITGPTISLTPLVNTSYFTARTLTASITDFSGVPTTGAGLPVLYWKKNTSGTYTAATGTFISGSTYSFNFGAGVVLNDTVFYYLAAQDKFTTPNVSTSPIPGSGGFSINPPAASIPPSTPNYYKVVNAMPSSVNVGVGQIYTSLTGAAPGGLFAAINNNILTGNLTANITSNLTEDGTNALKQWLEEGPGSGGFSVLIVPASASLKLVAGSNISDALITLNGAKRVTIDGSYAESGKYLTFRNTTSGGFYPTIYFRNDASNNTITNCTIEGPAAADQLGVILFGQSNITGNDNNTISYCTIRDRSDAPGIPANLIRSVSSINYLTIQNSGNVIRNNTMFNFMNNGFSSNEGNADWTITGNEIYQTAPGTDLVFGINFGSGGTSNIISGNNIHDLKFTQNGLMSINAGILIQGGQNVIVSKNKIWNFSSTPGSLNGILFFGSGNTASMKAINNQITIDPPGNTNQQIYGIFDNGFGGNHLDVYNNSIYIGGVNTGSGISWGFLRQPISGNTIDTVRNNIFCNARIGFNANNYALGDERSANNPVVVSNNVYIGSGIISAQIMDRGIASGTEVPETFASWVSATHDISSYALTRYDINAASLFKDISNGDLNIDNTRDTCWLVNGKGLPLTFVTDDFDAGNLRSTQIKTGSTDIGSDEFSTATLPPALTQSGSHAPGQTELFSFAGRTLTTITWGNTGTLPVMGNIRHYTGVWPNDTTNNNTLSGGKFVNEWWDIPASGGAGYTYGIKLNYDSAMIGSITNESSTTVYKKQSGVAGTWSTVLPTTVDLYNKSWQAGALNSFSEFTGTIPGSRVYTFNGNGDWTNSANWVNASIPPLTLAAPDIIVINPLPGGECIVNVVNQHVSLGAQFIINPNAKMRILSNLNIQ